MKHKKMAMLRINAASLHEILQLPDCAEIVSIEPVHGVRGCGLNIVIEGAGWATPPGAHIYPTGPGIVHVDRNADGSITRLTIDWGLPGAGSCQHHNTQAIDPAYNSGEALRCVDCGCRRRPGEDWSAP